MNKYIKLICTTSLLAFAGVASAVPTSTFIYTDTNPGGNPNGGDLSNVRSSYNEGAGNFLWEYTISSQNGSGVDHDGFWLVVNDGSNPKGHTNIAIFYGDLETNRLLAYRYNGLNNDESWTIRRNHAETWNDVMDIQQNAGGTETTVSFQLDVSSLNSRWGGDWEGAAYDESAGIWFHPTAGADFEYRNQGNRIRSFDSGQSGWYDVAWRGTREISEPGAGMLLAAGIFGIGAATRRKRIKAAKR